MLAVVLSALLASSPLVLGGLIAIRHELHPRLVGNIGGFGAGTLISAVAYDLVLPGAKAGDPTAIAVGLACGALTFYGVNRLLERGGNASPAVKVTLGALLDGIPESVAIGISALSGSTVSLAVVIAITLSNIPEGLVATRGLRRDGRSPGWIMAMWCVIATVCVGSAVLGYILLAGASDAVLSAIQSFAAGAILTMVTTAMVPEAYHDGGNEVGLLAVLGFALASALAAHSG